MLIKDCFFIEEIKMIFNIKETFNTNNNKVNTISKVFDELCHLVAVKSSR